jgi:hypothetical protein
MPVSDAKWDGSASRFPSTEAYCRSCLIDENPPGATKTQDRCHLPIREPGGAINRNAVHAAAAALAGGRGGVGGSAESKRSAASRLVGIYRRDLREEPPDSLVKMAAAQGMNRALRSATGRSST